MQTMNNQLMVYADDYLIWSVNRKGIEVKVTSDEPSTCHQGSDSGRSDRRLSTLLAILFAR